jgi:hypothetical protein
MNSKKQNADAEKGDEKLPGYPHYPAREDIYNQEEKTAFDEEEIPKNEGASIENELDIPSTKLDDQDEAIGQEDEENNVDGISGDDDGNPEEDNGQ